MANRDKPKSRTASCLNSQRRIRQTSPDCGNPLYPTNAKRVESTLRPADTTRFNDSTFQRFNENHCFGRLWKVTERSPGGACGPPLVAKMLPIVADPLPQMLPFKFLPFNDVTDVTAFPTSYINTCPTFLVALRALAKGFPKKPPPFFLFAYGTCPFSFLIRFGLRLVKPGQAKSRLVKAFSKKNILFPPEP